MNISSKIKVLRGGQRLDMSAMKVGRAMKNKARFTDQIKVLKRGEENEKEKLFEFTPEQFGLFL